MAELAKQALNVSRVGQVDVVEFRDKLEQDVWTSYISVPRPDVLVVATNLEYLREVLNRTTTRAGARAFPIRPARMALDRRALALLGPPSLSP